MKDYFKYHSFPLTLIVLLIVWAWISLFSVILFG